MTLGECLEKTKKLINYYSVSGETIAKTDPTLVDYVNRARSAVDTAQKELAKQHPLVRRVVLTQHTLRPLDSHPGMTFLEGSMTLSGRGAGAFSLLCDGDLLARLEEKTGDTWQTLLEIAQTGRGKMETVYGSLNTLPAQDAEMRLVLEAEGAMVASVGLYRTFPRGEEIPVLDTRRFHPLPEDFGGLDAIHASPRFRKLSGRGFSVLEEGRIGFPWEFDGTAELTYRVYPRTICEETPEDTVLDLPEDAAETIAYYAAAMLVTDEDPNLAKLFLNLYSDSSATLDSGIGRQVRNVLFGGGW